MILSPLFLKVAAIYLSIGAKLYDDNKWKFALSVYFEYPLYLSVKMRMRPVVLIHNQRIQAHDSTADTRNKRIKRPDSP